MEKRSQYTFLNYCIAAVWLCNGLFCKLLNLVPRHEQIVAGILGDTNSAVLTRLIGVAEILMAVWILSGIKSRLNALTQISIISSMNLLEFVLVPELLLWGKFNIFFAFLLILVICLNEFVLKKTLIRA